MEISNIMKTKIFIGVVVTILLIGGVIGAGYNYCILPTEVTWYDIPESQRLGGGYCQIPDENDKIIKIQVKGQVKSQNLANTRSADDKERFVISTGWFWKTFYYTKSRDDAVTLQENGAAGKATYVAVKEMDGDKQIWAICGSE